MSEDVLWPQARAAVDAAAGERSVVADGEVDRRRREARLAAGAEPRVPVDRVEDVDARGVPCRLYTPADPRPGVVVHVHGGGFVFHDVEVHDNAARRLALACGVAVLSVDYRRPPEHRFPAAPDDLTTVTEWVRAGFAGPKYLHGDSAGGNLALVTALRHPGVYAALALTYPFLDPEAAGASYGLQGVGFDPAEAVWYWQQYAASAADLRDPDLAPLRSTDARLATLPPTLVTTADGDPLRDEGELLAHRLAGLGVQVTATRYLGQLHGFWRHVDVFDPAAPLTAQVAGFFSLHATT